MKRILFILSFSILFYGCNSSCIMCGCDNIEDCISKNKFDEARKYQSQLPSDGLERKFFSVDRVEHKNPALFKIISAEAKFWLNQNDLERALKISEELKLIQTEHNFEGDFVSMLDVNTKYYELKYAIIRKYCINGRLEEAKSIVQEFSQTELLDKEERHISYSTGERDVRVAKCLKIYNTVKKGLKSNQEIEAFKGTDLDDYIIKTFIYPREEGLKIIKEFSNEN